MNEEQVKSFVRSLVSTFGGMVAGYFAAKGWFTVDQVLSVLNSGTFVGLVTSIVVALWGLWVHTQSNSIAVVDKIPAVAGVVTKPTVEGKALADSIPSRTVATAGTVAAQQIASK